MSVHTLKRNWQLSWENAGFKLKLIAGMTILVSIFLMLPSFFLYIENRDGTVLNDWVLAAIPAKDVSVPIMILIWGMIFLFTIRMIAKPQLFLRFLIAYVLITATRCLTIYLVPLGPPLNMIGMTDPLTDIFYGGHAISKDLFYSGHTSLLFLIYLCVEKKVDKYLAGCCTLAVGILLLVQHVHYTTDVVFAPLFSTIAFQLGKKWAECKTTTSPGEPVI
ncbi:phosphatase PAP2-related protein [uncultured Chitinophaga sp.]|jgi:hypothetical protein|uniref:phosphatase PAP2-related protein n=1 Tax=uncultured Chitinophaga sp. TaxID=339340 RepID=UPI002609ACF2|nr:phosphatase PAP2-related protein [uncultured Chitinophaga sp.]